MNRRDALSRVALILGGTVAGAHIFLEGCKPADRKTTDTFSADDIAYLDEIAETIIPATDTPGAKAAAVGTFMTVMVTDCYAQEEQEVFKQGMNLLKEASNKKFGKSFMDLSAEQRTELLTETDREAKDYMSAKKAEEPKHYFRMMKELTLLGYFTSQPGAEKSLRYMLVPGKYEGCVPYKKGDRAWAL
ncbi:MAG: gluconate 2-dehydrogenase subunit 3 family protein [Chitinophagaceae bacterium]|nr:gluconate 2-dehydrogenase subunit 3 family protein [Chitinophagaceae bacterium]MCW5925347.1 gluconate 2-dehydrogenase subunit 3 family protein [Chitinophagaceae bacterium]